MSVSHLPSLSCPTDRCFASDRLGRFRASEQTPSDYQDGQVQNDPFDQDDVRKSGPPAALAISINPGASSLAAIVQSIIPSFLTYQELAPEVTVQTNR